MVIMKKIIIFALVFVMLNNSLVSADFLDWVTGKVTVEPSTINILNEGETKLYTINGKDYEVTLDYVNPTSTKFSINGEITPLIPVYDSYKLADGAIISVKNITYQDFAGGVKKAEFTLSVGEKNADYFFAVDDHSPAEDILLMQDIISNLQLDLPIGNAKLNSEITRADLANRVTTFIYYQNVLIIVGDTSPAEHVIFAQKISNYLKGRGIISIQKLSSEITSDDLTKEIEICSDSDDGKDYYVKGITRIWDRPEFNEDYCSGNRLSEFYCNEAGGTSEFYYTCPYGCEGGVCLKEYGEKISCTDSDNGKNYYIRGFTKGHEEPNGIYDACADADEVYEHYCENNFVKVERYKCSSGKCIDGACIQDKVLPPFTAAVYDKAPSSDVIIISDTLLALKGKGYGQVPVGSSKLFSEVNAFNLDNKVTLAVYLGEAVIIVGEHSPASHVIFAVDIKEILSKKGITPQTILNSEVPSADLLDLFEEEDEDIEIPEEEETQEPTITPPTQIKVQPDKCKTNADCSDNNTCTSDLCSGTPKKCSYIEVSLGCNYNGNCIPIGVRAENNYCDIDRTIKSQLGAGEECNNNYECSTNICVNNQCISPSFIQKIIDWFKKLFGG